MRPALAAAILAGAALARLDASAMDLSSLWDYSDPQASEQRFRQALATAGPDDALILQTQIARTFGLRGDFAQARRILEGVQDAIPGASAEAQARYLLELGRTYASTAHRPEETSPEAEAKARSLYTAAFEKARDARLDALAIDALHMMPMVDTAPADQLRWDLKAIAYMESSSQADAKRWEGSLRNNVGYAQHLLGHYDEALREYRLSLAAYERDGRPANARIAWWMIARTMRAQGRYPEAIDIQRRLEQEWDAAGHPDPDVYEELEQLYRATGDVALADRYAAKLHASTE